MHVSIPGWVDAHDRLLIRCRRGLFRTDYVGLRQSYLWVIDCRRGGGRHGAGAWGDDQYMKVIEHLKTWMIDVDRLNVVLLLPLGVNFIPDMLTKMKLPADCTHLRRSWSFRTTPIDYPHNLKEGANSFQAVEALGNVLIYFHHPIDSTTELNVGVADTALPLSFHDCRGSTQS